MRTNYIWSFLVAFVLALTTGIGQTTLLDETFRDGSAPAGWTTNDVVFETAADGYARLSTLTASIVSPSFDASAFGQLEVNFDVAKFGAGEDGPVTVEVSTDGGANFSVAGVSPVPTSATYLDASLTITTLSSTMVLRFTRPDSPSQKRFRDLEVIASGTPGGGAGQIELTYNEGIFPVSYPTFDPTCSEAFLEVEIPEGSVISSVDVSYSVTSKGGSFTEEHRSRLAVVGGGNEGNFIDCNHPSASGLCGFNDGTVDYTRQGLTFAQGESGIVTFELQVHGIWPTFQDCTPTYYEVPNGSWVLTVNYIDEPDCGAVTGLTVVNQTDTSVDLAWSEATGVSTYNWAIYTQGSVAGTDTPVFEGSTTNETLTVTGLNANTSYFAIVQGECEGGELGLPSQATPFTTECGPQTGDFLENFNSTAVGQIPDCWNKIENTFSFGLFDVVNFGPAFSAPNNLRASSSGDADAEFILVSPVLTDLDNGRRVTFYARQTAGASANAVELGVMSDPEDAATFTSLESFTLSGTTFRLFVVDVPDTVTEEHFALKVTFSTTFQTVYIDNISYEATPPCDFIDGLVIDGFDQESVDFSWDALDNAVSYNWEVYETGDQVGVDTPIAEGNSPTNSASATGLDSNTSYFVVVSGDCGPEDGLGANSAPASFTTLCDAFSSPFGLDFEETEPNTFPSCWLSLNSAPTSGVFNVTTFFAPVLQGARQFQASSGDNDAVQRYLISPELTDLTDNDKRVTFLARTSSTVANNATISLGIMDNPNDPNTFIELNSWTLTTTPTLYQGDINFAFTESHFALRFSYGATFITSLVDDIQYFDVPECDVPQEVVNEDLSFTTADFSWNPVPSAESYNWVVVLSGNDPTNEDNIVASGNTTETEAFVEELDAEVAYQFFVKSDCDALGEGEFSQPVNFFTGYCVPSSLNTGDFITNFTTTVALTNVSIVKSSISPGGYGNLSQNEIITVFPGSSFNFSNTFNFANHNVGIWIDWNENLVFDASEQVFQAGDTANNTETGTISIPSDIELGSYRMRVRARWSQSPLATPCGEQSFAEALDFTILVVDEPDCLAPSDLVIDDVTADTVNFSWEAVASAESYEWEIYNAADVIGVNTPVDLGVAVVAEASSTALDSNTPYKVVVKSICGAESESLFSSAVNFRTDCDLFFATFNEGFEDTPVGQIPFCWNRILSFDLGFPSLEVTNFDTPVFGSRQIRFNSSSDPLAQLTFVSPELGDFDDSKRVTFFARNSFSAGTSLEVGTMTDPEDASTFEVVETVILPAAMQFFAVNFLDVTTETHFAFRPVFTGTFQTVVLDEITYEEIPACDIPLNVAGDLESSTSATFTWNEVIGAESYDWLLVLSGDDPEEVGNIIQSGNVLVNEVLVEDLITNEVYDFYVSAECGDQGVGDLSDPATLSVSACVSGVGPNQAFDTHISLIEFFGEGDSGINIQDNCPPQLGVQDETSTEIIVFSGETYTLTVERGFCNGNVYDHVGEVWIDFNQNLTFDAEESQGTWSGVFGSVGLVDLDIVIPEDTPFGDYRGRVMMQEFATLPLNPCASFAYGSVIDFIITVTDPDAAPGGDEPMDPAPTPTEDENLVISLFSNAYSDVPVDTWLTSWSVAQLEDIQIQGVDTKKYTNLDFAGVEMTGANSIDLDAANMTKFHVDFWTPNMTIVRVKLVDFGPDNAFGGGDDSEHEVVFEDLAIGEWNSLEIELSVFEGLVNTSNISQLIFSGLVDNVPGVGTLFVDNVYFSSASLSSGSFDTTSFNYYPNPVKSYLNIQSASKVEKIEVYNVLGQRVLLEKPNTTNPSIEMSNLNTGVYLMNVSVNGTQKTFQVIKE